MTTRRAGIYARISKDDGTALGVGRQLEDCTAEAERRGWRIVDRYVDNNVSASKTKPRPEYLRMIADAEQGRIDAVICWDVDRLTRKAAELESFIDLADRHGLALASVGGEIDLATPQGRLTARIKGSVARHEAEQMGRRIARKAEQTAREGLSTVGPAPFGYERREVPRNGSQLKMNDRWSCHDDQTPPGQTRKQRVLPPSLTRDINVLLRALMLALWVHLRAARRSLCVPIRTETVLVS